MYWTFYADMRGPKVEPEVLNSCAICCRLVPAREMWGVQDEEHEKRGWMICNRHHSEYELDPLTAWQKAEDRWNTDGPCTTAVKEQVLSGR